MSKENYWGIVPAAGSGKRMQMEIPKQYINVAGKTVLDHTLTRLLSHPAIHKIIVALAIDDPYWADSQYSADNRVVTIAGGTERFNSVDNALLFLQNLATADDWVLVHDAARPCLTYQDIDLLIHTLDKQPVGGSLGAPIVDTVKSVNANNEVNHSVDRTPLWRAFTPQMFRFGLLCRAFAANSHNPAKITDEASAIEQLGYQPKMVHGDTNNIKITSPEDLTLAKWYLTRANI